MSHTIEQIRSLIREQKVRVSRHGYDELANDGLYFDELLAGFESAVVVEDYPAFVKGPCVLVLQQDSAASPVHVLWGVAAGSTEPAVLVIAYRPDPTRWDADFLRRSQ